MAFKLVILAAFIADAVNAGGLLGASIATSYAAGPLVHSASVTQSAPLVHSASIAKIAAPLAVAKTVVAEQYDPNPQYSYGYDVQDGLTGDSKSQVESRSGDVVQGAYSVVDPDGTKRTVEYTADPINGFNAVVHREPVVAAPAKVTAPLAYAAPIAKVAAPLAYSASLLH